MTEPPSKQQVLALSGEHVLMGLECLLERKLTAQEIDLALGLALHLVNNEGLAAARAALELAAHLRGVSVEVLYVNLAHGIASARFESGDMAMEISWGKVQVMPCV